MPLNTWLAAQEAILNRFLKLDPESSKVLNNLSGKVVKLELNSLTHYWLFKSDTIYLTKNYSGVVDLVLRGSVFDFMRLAFMKKESALTAMPIQVSGDMEFAKQFKDLFSNLEIDWEEQLSRVVGDTIAYPIAQFFKSLSQWAKQSIDDLSQNVTDYVQAEMDYLVPDEELQIFFADIDDLRDDAARLEARMNRVSFCKGSEA
ncbi:ubiquinone biosynthesis protein UbiJ contains SCP2 domain [Candidatus Rickettsiella viridis]|uniref:Ubiquinone biosynthesis accessory factor UbiJ n=1 Tax=Candidatus Rickettsiella viridis TaxID=676208 RepID=A0A2Z5UWD4_9COXI|nr:SCP2 sterol-binding domain-containing protein [Candidatus Rickettsiella viridis]BBB15879.1 ubiquinone biosynthesis protein UbiJ contains SCP2 domain [Candidatus Rickettsiella viridis]